ncbi:hypothetical protein EXIGLDRAFT_695625 [Exidia glandulosa HHB12029]|uniref:C2H2-type domain-containing protein n=1 Tax=Exidia glandulosa HHB12029 TaxID=1314781 RepID=A0A165FR52_EXIGL|nr:hypothetical protein EXIGLDRAFT_695625 [Exidia glandulosa HHB12029]
MAESAYPCKWASCTKICASDQALYEHLLQEHAPLWQAHTDYRPFVCNVSPICTKNFKTANALGNHLKNKNYHRSPTIQSTPSCKWKACTEMLPDPPALLEHISKFHSSNGAKDICLWTECAHRSALKWKLDSCLPSWYEPILSEEDESGKPLLTHTHVKRKNRMRKGGLGTKGDAEEEIQVQAKRQRAQVPDPESEDDGIAYMDDLEVADYALVRRTSRRGAKRLRKSNGEDEGEDSGVAKPLAADEWNGRDKVAHENINSTSTTIPVHKPQPFKVRMGKSGEDIAYEDEYYAPTPRLSRSPSPNWMSAFEAGASYQDDPQNVNYASSIGQSPSPRWIYGLETAASSPTVVTPVQEQEYDPRVSTAVDLDDSKLDPGPDANERVGTIPPCA